MADVVSNFIGTIPFGYAIGAPLKAVIEGQGLAAMSSLDFIQKVGFDTSGDKTKVRTVDFDLKSGGRTVNLEAPLLAMVNVPFIRIQQTVINLDCKIHSVQKSSESSKHQDNISGSFGFFLAKINANVSYSSEKNRHSSLEKTGEVKVNVIAVQDEMPEGLRALLGLMRDGLNDLAENKQAKKQSSG